ncbi:MAG: hypothetical protein ACE37F_19055 [Nannocystaceae bacterium]|nr:hypothetical protein [bacterium]
MFTLRLWLCSALALAACDSSLPEGPAVRPESKKGPPLAKDDPRFQPYVPKPKPAMDFSGVDVGDAAMDGAAESLEALGEAILEALGANDSAALAKLAVTESEYKDRFFPVTVHHRSGLGLGADLAWAELHGESRGDMNTALERYGGQTLEFVRLEAKEITDRPKVRLHLRPKLVVKDASGREQTLVMLGSILEHTPSGGFKVLAFRDTP